MKRPVILTAAISSCLTVLALWSVGMANLPSKVKLENAKVKVSEVTYEPGVPRERYIRPTDQVIVFLDDSRYERTDSRTKEKTIRERKSGDVIWHDKGEDAPVLINLGTKPYRTLTIELK
ncbi:MAG TPA: hypothetical protein VEX68_27105 [Bryobacteraceae bacterium]|nr:hypothetical protein [Bryobacteraceae bacterium]